MLHQTERTEAVAGSLQAMRSISRLVIIIGVVIALAGGLVWLIGAISAKAAATVTTEECKPTRTEWPPQRFELNEPGEWMLTVTNVDTVTWKPATYKLWANKPYRVMSSDPETGKRLEAKMPKTAMYWYGARADFGVGHLWMAAIDSGTVVMVQRVM